MQRFHRVARPETLSHKANEAPVESGDRALAARRGALQVAGFLGMDAIAGEALARLLALAEGRKIGVAGRFMPDDGVSARLAERGIEENVEEADFFRLWRVVIPYGGMLLRQRRSWEEAGYPLEDFTSPRVRRTQVTLGLLGMEGARGLVIGRHDDPESQALAGSSPGTRIVQDTNDIARLEFAPAFGVVCQTTLSPRRVAWLVQQLRFRYRDARVTFLDTTEPSMAAREEALEKLLVTCDRVVIVGQAGEASCEALMETALRRGKPAVVVAGPDALQAGEFEARQRVALSAGAFALADSISAVSEALARR